MLELNEYQNKGLIWYGYNNDNRISRMPTGFAEMDLHLNGGLPSQGIIDIKSYFGIGELRLLMPFIAAQQGKGQVVFIDPPVQLNAEFLLFNQVSLERTWVLSPYQQASSLWSAEQCLNSGCCSVVVLWQQNPSIKQTRRLMLACEQGGASLILLRYQSESSHLFSLPSAISLSVMPDERGVAVKVDKQKGGRATDKFAIDMSEKWPDLITNQNRERQGTKDNVVAFRQVAVTR